MRPAPHRHGARVKPAKPGPANAPARRRALLDWAARQDAWIVEDDFLSELQLRGRAAPALAALDSAGRVLHIGTFSKTISPILRLGFIVVPAEKARLFTEVAACLAPYSSYDVAQGGSDTTAPTIPSSAAVANPDGTVGSGSLPADTGHSRQAPGVACNEDPTALVASSALGNASVSKLTPAVGTDGYTVGNSGSSVSIGADLAVQGISLDVLVGDVAAN